MDIEQKDRCPRCGTPFMSMLKAGEPDTRYCYTCETATGSAAMASRLEAAADQGAQTDELELQGLEGAGASGEKRPGRMAPGLRPRKPARAAA